MAHTAHTWHARHTHNANPVSAYQFQAAPVIAGHNLLGAVCEAAVKGLLVLVKHLHVTKVVCRVVALHP